MEITHIYIYNELHQKYYYSYSVYYNVYTSALPYIPSTTIAFGDASFYPIKYPGTDKFNTYVTFSVPALCGRSGSVKYIYIMLIILLMFIILLMKLIQQIFQCLKIILIIPLKI